MPVKNAPNAEIKTMVVPFVMDTKQMGENEDFYTFEGYASTFNNIDLGLDRVMEGAFKECIQDNIQSQKRLPVLWQHNWEMPLGIYLEMREDAKGLFVKGQMPKEDEFVAGRVMPQMKAGSINAMSIGYMVSGSEWVTEEGREIRNLTKVQLYEISLVTLPMNPQAQITGMKSIESLEIKDFEDLTARRLDEMLRGGIKLSRNATKKLISCLDFEKLQDADGQRTRDAEEKEAVNSLRETIKELKNL